LAAFVGRACLGRHGNHGNLDLLAKYPIGEWNGGKVRFIGAHVIHLLRGQVWLLWHCYSKPGLNEKHRILYKEIIQVI